MEPALLLVLLLIVKKESLTQIAPLSMIPFQPYGGDRKTTLQNIASKNPSSFFLRLQPNIFLELFNTSYSKKLNEVKHTLKWDQY